MAPVFPRLVGKLPRDHPLLKVRSEFRQIFLEMGFQEMPTNNFVESSFWNFDAARMRADSAEFVELLRREAARLLVAVEFRTSRQQQDLNLSVPLLKRASRLLQEIDGDEQEFVMALWRVGHEEPAEKTQLGPCC